nr:unnamed protein product [Spirometra erinaceieuropaei]
MWQPNLNKLCSLHSSGADLMEKCWIKWNSQGLLDYHAKSSAANHPDWYARRMADVRATDLKYTQKWAYDRWGKPNSLNALGFIGPEEVVKTRETRFFLRDCSTRRPQKVSADIPTVRYGQLHPPHYDQPMRAELFPPLVDAKHLPSLHRT